MVHMHEPTVSEFDLIHAAVCCGAERVAVPELSVEPERIFIRCICGPVLGTSNGAEEYRHQQRAQKQRNFSASCFSRLGWAPLTGIHHEIAGHDLELESGAKHFRITFATVAISGFLSWI